MAWMLFFPHTRVPMGQLGIRVQDPEWDQGGVRDDVFCERQASKDAQIVRNARMVACHQNRGAVFANRSRNHTPFQTLNAHPHINAPPCHPLRPGDPPFWSNRDRAARNPVRPPGPTLPPTGTVRPGPCRLPSLRPKTVQTFRPPGRLGILGVLMWCLIPLQRPSVDGTRACHKPPSGGNAYCQVVVDASTPSPTNVSSVFGICGRCNGGRLVVTTAQLVQSVRWGAQIGPPVLKAAQGSGQSLPPLCVKTHRGAMG